jgi:uncharacterized radical SAM protein YgiQ
MDTFLPTSREELSARGWESCDFVIISGDAYVDHPSFGPAIIGRYLESLGYRAGIIPQPDWTDGEAFRVLERPELAFLVTAGNLDSMVNHYTSAKKRRKNDAYSPGGRSGLRPDRAVIAYTSRAKQAYKGVPVILGGIEASLRRLSHYDYWSDSIRRSILLDAKADLLVYGMGERPLAEIARRLRSGTPVSTITGIPGTVWKTKDLLSPLPPHSAEGHGGVPRQRQVLELPSFGSVSDRLSGNGKSPADRAFAESTRIRLRNQDPFTALPLAERYGDWYVVQAPPALPLATEELDRVYALPFTRRWHPRYDSTGGVPALDEVRFSITASRGCFGGCSFCALGLHQGRIVTSRSRESILAEARSFTRDPGFKGIIHDVGGPTANFRVGSCARQATRGCCPDKECLYPEPCSALAADHTELKELLAELRALPEIKKVFIRSGIRYDYLLEDRDEGFFDDLVKYHVSGQLKVAPEHASRTVLEAMGKPPIEVFSEFAKLFEAKSSRAGKKQYLIPYFITAHPGTGLDEAVELAEFLKSYGFIPDQVQEFLPTPGTVSTCMYATGIDPRTMKPVYVPRSREEREMQRALVHFHKPRNYNLVRKALRKAGREDLIGRGKECLVPP